MVSFHGYIYLQITFFYPNHDLIKYLEKQINEVSSTIVRKSIINLLNVLCKGDICLHENDKAVKYLGFCPITLCLLKLPYLCTNKFINRKVEFRETEWCSLESWDCLGRSDSATCRHCILHAPFLLPTVKKMEEMPSLPSLSFISCQDPTNGKLGARQLVDILHSCQAEGIKQGGEWYLSLERKKKKAGVKAPGKAYAARVVKWGIWSTGREDEVSSPYQSLGIICITHCSCHITVLSLVQDTDTCKAESDQT